MLWSGFLAWLYLWQRMLKFSQTEMIMKYVLMLQRPSLVGKSGAQAADADSEDDLFICEAKVQQLS